MFEKAQIVTFDAGVGAGYISGMYVGEEEL